MANLESLCSPHPFEPFFKYICLLLAISIFYFFFFLLSFFFKTASVLANQETLLFLPKVCQTSNYSWLTFQ